MALKKSLHRGEFFENSSHIQGVRKKSYLIFFTHPVNIFIFLAQFPKKKVIVKWRHLFIQKKMLRREKCSDILYNQ